MTDQTSDESVATDEESRVHHEPVRTEGETGVDDQLGSSDDPG